jgi:hypothetical protein
MDRKSEDVKKGGSVTHLGSARGFIYIIFGLGTSHIRLLGRAKAHLRGPLCEQIWGLVTLRATVSMHQSTCPVFLCTVIEI